MFSNIFTKFHNHRFHHSAIKPTTVSAYLSSGALSIQTIQMQRTQESIRLSPTLSQIVACPAFLRCICFFKFSMPWTDSSFSPWLVSPPPLPPFLLPEFLPLSSYLISMLRPVGAISPSCLHSFLPPCLSDIGSVGQHLLTDIACSPWIQSSFYSQSLPLSLFLSLFHKNRSLQLTWTFLA